MDMPKVASSLHLMARKRLDECVCCSKSVYDVMKPYLSNVSFARNGIEPMQTYSDITRAEIDVPEDARVFLYAGVLNSRKNITWLVEKFAQYQDFYLLEDYYLWLQMLMAGYQGYNIQKPLFHMMAGSDMYLRRAGWKYAKIQANCSST